MTAPVAPVSAPARIDRPTRQAQVTPPSPRQLPLQTQATPAIAVPAPAATSGHLNPADIGQNISDNATAVSGNVIGVNTATVNAGPVGGSQTGNNDILVNQRLNLRSGDAVAGSIVSSRLRGLNDGLFVGLSNFAGRDRRFWSSDPFFFGHNTFFFGRSHFLDDDDSFFSSADFLRVEILADMVEDCFDRLRSNFSFTRYRICHNLLDRLAEESHGFFFDPFLGGFFGSGLSFDPFFFGTGAILSVGGTNAMFGNTGLIYSSHGQNVMIGRTGVIISGSGGNLLVGPTGLIANFPGGHASSEGVGVLLFAPFGLVLLPFDGSFHHHRHHPFGRHRAVLVDDDFDDVFRDFRLFGVGFGAFEHHRHGILGTMHFHSSFDDGPLISGCCLFSPFGHRTVLITDDVVLVSGAGSFTFWSHGIHFHCFTVCFAHFHHRFFIDPVFFGCNHLFFDGCFGLSDVVLDLPGITIGAGRFI